jgi:hypothetical protein
MTRSTKQLTQKLFRIAILIGLLAILLSFTACDRRNEDPNSIQVTDFFILDGRSVLYQDDGNSWLTAVATVRDNKGFPVPEQVVRFRSSKDPVKFRRTTISDSSGTAMTEIYVQGSKLIPSHTDSVYVTVSSFIGDKKQKDLKLLVKRSPDVSFVELEGVSQIETDINKNLQFRARVWGIDGEPLAAGAQVRFTSSNGLGSFYRVGQEGFSNPIANTDEYGIATIMWNSGTKADTTRIYASISGQKSSDKSSCCRDCFRWKISFRVYQRGFQGDNTCLISGGHSNKGSTSRRKPVNVINIGILRID